MCEHDQNRHDLRDPRAGLFHCYHVHKQASPSSPAYLAPPAAHTRPLKLHLDPKKANLTYRGSTLRLQLWKQLQAHIQNRRQLLVHLMVAMNNRNSTGNERNFEVQMM